ncbi:MAG: IPT/TIG domain-containing protein [Tannerella sp.]|jgi:hypothetical protein|nr:IPT/TIG domain-containing protein [Tannerella sp.]
MKTYKYPVFLALFVLLWALVGCNEDEMDFSEDYDIPWIVSVISSVSPLKGAPGTTITLNGENMGADMVAADGVKIGIETCTIVSQTATSIVVTVPDFTAANPLEISVSNLHNRTFVFGEQFTPELP